MPVLVKSDDVRVEERPRLVTAGYGRGRHRSQWVKTEGAEENIFMNSLICLLHWVLTKSRDFSSQMLKKFWKYEAV